MKSRLVIPNEAKLYITRLLGIMGIEYKWITHDIIALYPNDFKRILGIIHV